MLRSVVWFWFLSCGVALGNAGCAEGEAAPDVGGRARDLGPPVPEQPLADMGQPGNDATPGTAGGDASVPISPGDPLAISEREAWVWVPMETMQCANGSSGGFAVNLTDRSRELVLYLQGGGVCHNTLTCSASLIDSVGDDPLRTALDGGVTSNQGIFDRSDPTNPFRDANFAVLPHCTGDHHIGDSVRSYGARTVHHHGFANVARTTERLLATFPDASRVTVSGFSAGGVGITGNYQRIAQSFEAVGGPTPFLVIDAGPFLQRPHLAEGSESDLIEAWNLEETVLPYCEECVEQGLSALYRANLRAHPGLRQSLLCA